MEALHKRAKIAIASDEPKTPHKAAQCLSPAMCAYAEEMFDRLAEAKLKSYRSAARPRTYGQWLRSKCQSAVIEDVCKVIAGQFYTTVQQIAESIPDSGEGGRTRRALWRVLCTEWEPHAFSRDLETHLRSDLDDRSLYWEAQSVNRRAGDLAGPERSRDESTHPEAGAAVNDTAPKTVPAKKKKREPHPDPEAILAGKQRVTYGTAAMLLGVTERRVRQLVEENHLACVGEGHAKQISASSIRSRLNLPRNSEESGNPRK
jgi:hypothetical protein